MLAMKVLSLVIYYNEKPHLPKESKEKSCNSSLSVCFQHYIGNNVLVGMGAVLMDNVVVPDNTIIAAGAVVLSNSVLEPGIYAGVPAKKVKDASETIGAAAHKNAQGYLMYKDWYKDPNYYKDTELK